MHKSRFKCQVLLDDAAVLACKAYVDLNPIRAGLAPDLASSPHTSVQRRLLAADQATPTTPLHPIAGSTQAKAMPATLAQYLQLTDMNDPLRVWTGRIVRADKRGAIAADTPPVVKQLGLADHQWHAQVIGIEKRYWRAVGAVDALIEKARAMGQCWLKGVGEVRLEPRSP